jgi:transposase
MLGASSYTFAEATFGQELRHWIDSHMRAFEFFRGVTEIVVPDNLKSAVTHPSYYEPDLNPTYRDLGQHLWRGNRPYRARDNTPAPRRWAVCSAMAAPSTGSSVRGGSRFC